MFKKKNLFKIGNEGGGASSSASDQLNNINSATNNNQPRLLSHRENHHHQYLLNQHNHQQNFDLGLNYSHIPVALPHYPHNIQAQTFIPTHKQPIGYDDFPTLHSEAPLMVKQLMTNPREQCDSGGENIRYQTCETGLEIGTCEPSSQNMVTGGREEGLNEWGMIDKLHEDPNASSMHQINHLSLRGEMDFWGYGK